MNQVLDAHPEARLVYENLSVASMRFHARCMNAYLYASQLGHIPDQLAWAAAKRGIAAHTVNPAYSSQECPRCHFVSRANRPDQKTFRCVVCGYQAHADHKAALVLAFRWAGHALHRLQDQRGRQSAAPAATCKLETGASRAEHPQVRGDRTCPPVERQGLPRDLPGIIV